MNLGRHISAILILTSLILATACAAAAPQAPSRAPETAPAAPAANAPGAAQSQASGDRMIIRTAYLQLVVADINDVISKASSLAQEIGGYVVSSESQQQGTGRIGKFSLRVPSERLDEALGKLRGLATRVDRDSVSNKDVTEEYVDQDARLRTLKATENQYLELMKNTRTTEDIIKVQQSLQQVRQQIEQTEGRIKYLERSTEMAIINADLVTAGAARPLSDGGWNAMDIVNTAAQALISAALLLAGLAIWIIVFVPIWGPLVLFIRWWRGRKRRAPGPPAQPVGGTT